MTDPMNKRVRALEKTIQHLSRRAPGRVIAIIPPTLVSFYAEKPSPEGVLCSFVCPVEAEVTTVAFHMNSGQLAKDAEVTLTHSGLLMTAQRIALKRDRFVEEVSYKLSPGDMLQVAINHPDMVRDVSISVILKIAQNASEKIRKSMDDFLREPSDA